MQISFEKWHGSGNDFILIDDREGLLPRNVDWIVQVCDRHLGIGSDGIIFIKSGNAYEMDFYNPDGSQSFCGNGSRCAFAFFSSLVKNRSDHEFIAIDGLHKGSWQKECVRIEMRDVNQFERYDSHIDLVFTGSPHLLVWVDDPMELNLIKEAHHFRYNERFKEQGINVNFLAWRGDHLIMRTYERGVEGETLSCGTGVTAAGLSAMWRGKVKEHCMIKTRGGELAVAVSSFEEGRASGITLEGPVQKVFEGTIELP